MQETSALSLLTYVSSHDSPHGYLMELVIWWGSFENYNESFNQEKDTSLKLDLNHETMSRNDSLVASASSIIPSSPKWQSYPKFLHQIMNK